MRLIIVNIVPGIRENSLLGSLLWRRRWGPSTPQEVRFANFVLHSGCQRLESYAGAARSDRREPLSDAAALRQSGAAGVGGFDPRERSRAAGRGQGNASRTFCPHSRGAALPGIEAGGKADDPRDRAQRL